MPARTGVRSRAVDDRGRSSSSSDRGSAIEGFRQKIPLHDKLTDLGVKLGLAIHFGLQSTISVGQLSNLPTTIAARRKRLGSQLSRFISKLFNGGVVACRKTLIIYPSINAI